MGRYNSDELDRVCLVIKGHTNWAYFDTLTPDERKKVQAPNLRDYSSYATFFQAVQLWTEAGSGAMVVVFFDEPAEEEAEDENK